MWSDTESVKVKEKKVKEPRPLSDPKRFLSEHSSFFGIFTYRAEKCTPNAQT